MEIYSVCESSPVKKITSFIDARREDLKETITQEVVDDFHEACGICRISVNSNQE